MSDFLFLVFVGFTYFGKKIELFYKVIGIPQAWREPSSTSKHKYIAPSINFSFLVSFTYLSLFVLNTNHISIHVLFFRKSFLNTQGLWKKASQDKALKLQSLLRNKRYALDYKFCSLHDKGIFIIDKLFYITNIIVSSSLES